MHCETKPSGKLFPIVIIIVTLPAAKMPFWSCGVSSVPMASIHVTKQLFFFLAKYKLPHTSLIVVKSRPRSSSLLQVTGKEALLIHIQTKNYTNNNDNISNINHHHDVFEGIDCCQ